MATSKLPYHRLMQTIKVSDETKITAPVGCTTLFELDGKYHMIIASVGSNSTEVYRSNVIRSSKDVDKIQAGTKVGFVKHQEIGISFTAGEVSGDRTQTTLTKTAVRLPENFSYNDTIAFAKKYILGMPKTIKDKNETSLVIQEQGITDNKSGETFPVNALDKGLGHFLTVARPLRSQGLKDTPVYPYVYRKQKSITNAVTKVKTLKDEAFFGSYDLFGDYQYGNRRDLAYVNVQGTQAIVEMNIEKIAGGNGSGERWNTITKMSSGLSKAYMSQLDPVFNKTVVRQSFSSVVNSAHPFMLSMKYMDTKSAPWKIGIPSILVTGEGNSELTKLAAASTTAGNTQNFQSDASLPADQLAGSRTAKYNRWHPPLNYYGSNYGNATTGLFTIANKVSLFLYNKTTKPKMFSKMSEENFPAFARYELTSSKDKTKLYCIYTALDHLRFPYDELFRVGILTSYIYTAVNNPSANVTPGPHNWRQVNSTYLTSYYWSGYNNYLNWSGSSPIEQLNYTTPVPISDKNSWWNDYKGLALVPGWNNANNAIGMLDAVGEAPGDELSVNVWDLSTFPTIAKSKMVSNPFKVAGFAGTSYTRIIDWKLFNTKKKRYIAVLVAGWDFTPKTHNCYYGPGGYDEGGRLRAITMNYPDVAEIRLYEFNPDIDPTGYAFGVSSKDGIWTKGLPAYTIAIDPSQGIANPVIHDDNPDYLNDTVNYVRAWGASKTYGPFAGKAKLAPNASSQPQSSKAAFSSLPETLQYKGEFLQANSIGSGIMITYASHNMSGFSWIRNEKSEWNEVAVGKNETYVFHIDQLT